MAMSRELALICSVVFLYAVCYMAQAPLLPYLVQQVGLNANWFGILMSTFSCLQLLGSLISGPLVDAYGGKCLLLVSFASSAMCYSMTALASSVPMLFLSRLPTVMQHAVLAARTIATAHSAEDERAELLGYIGASYGLGFAVGPAVGGWLSSSGLATTAWAATAGSLLALLVVTFGVERAGAARASTPSTGHSPGQQMATAINARNLLAAARCPGVPPLLLVQAGAGLAGGIFQSTFSLVLQQQYKLTSKESGMVLSYVGGCIVFGQAVVIKQACRRLGEATAVRAGCALLALSLLGIGVSRQLWQLLLWLFPSAIATVLVVTTNAARLTKAVPSQMTGSIVALDMSISSGLRAVTPLIGIWLLQNYGYGVTCACAAAVLSVVLLVQSLPLCWTSSTAATAVAKKSNSHEKSS